MTSLQEDYVAARNEPAGRRLRIAMIGLKGLPATYGGIERHVEELGSRLAARGHDVTVYCRSSYGTEPLASYRGMRLVRVPTIASKHLDAIVHSAVATMAAIGAKPDIVHYHALGPGLVAPLPRYLSPSRVVLTVHGLDNERAKWSGPARAVLGAGHWMSGHVPDATIVVSRALAEHYHEHFRRPIITVANGVDSKPPLPAALIRSRYGLEPRQYALFVGRLVPEKAPDLLIQAWRRLPAGHRLVIAGDSSHTDRYADEVRRLAAADPRIVLTGYVYGDLLGELYSNAGVFVLPSLLEGLPLTLLEAASYGRPIVATAIPPHVEVLGADAPGHRLVPIDDSDALARAVADTFAAPDLATHGALGLRRHVLATYRWDTATDLTESLYQRIAAAAARPVHTLVA
jgi:glycosyltransferase involved in cell wall biosynthesis